MAPNPGSSNEIIPQADVGALSVRGLSAFMPVLAALSADDVVPTAVIQLEQLGSFFHINGQYAAKLPDVLQRCSSTRLDRIGILIGWRKGDTASIVAQTAGGQAVALLCFCLRNIYDEERCGEILYDLCERLVSRQISISSMKQLGHVSSLLASKTSTLGFGNILARQVVRIQDTYRQLEIPVPDGFFETMSRDGIVELLVAISAVFNEENCIARISGSQAMAHTAAILSVMFPEDLSLIVEGFTLQEGLRKKIIVTLNSRDQENYTTHVQTEYKLQGTPSKWLQLNIEPNRAYPSNLTESPYTFQWQGHVGDFLLLSFAQVGLVCSQALLGACADAVAAFAFKLETNYVKGENIDSDSIGFFSLLGPNPIYRLHQTCSRLLRVSPSEDAIDLKLSFANLRAEFNNVIKSVHVCSCISPCLRSNGWSFDFERCHSCITCNLWLKVGAAILQVILNSLVNAGANVAVPCYDFREHVGELTKLLYPISDRQVSTHWLLCDSFVYHSVLRFTRDYRGALPDRPLAMSNTSVTMYPTALRDLQRDIEKGFRFELCDGQLIFKGHYYSLLRSQEGSRRHKQAEPLPKPGTRIRPSAAGAHEDLHFAIRQASDSLKLRTTVFLNGQQHDVNLFGVIIAAMALENATPCTHDWDESLDTSSRMDVIEGSVALPVESAVPGHRITIVQTKGSRSAQMLACWRTCRPLLQGRCCLKCAVEQAKRENRRQVIVGL